MQTLQSARDSSSVVELTENLTILASEWPVVACSLDPLLVEPMAHEVMLSLKWLVDQVCKPPCASGGVVPNSSEDLKGVAALLVKSQKSFPFEARILVWRTDVGKLLSSAVHSGLMSALLELLGKVDTPEVVWAHAEEMLKIVPTLAADDLGQAETEALASVLGHSCRAAVALCPDEGTTLVIRVANAIAEVLPAAKIPCEAEALQAVIDSMSLVDNPGRLVAKATVDGTLSKEAVLNDESTFATVRLLVAKVAAHISTLPREMSFYDVLVGKLQVVLDGAMVLQKDVGLFDLERHVNCAVEALKPLLNVRHGRQGGGNWLDGLDDRQQTQWKAVESHAEATIGQDKAVAKMKPHLEVAIQALCSFMFCSARALL
jgi:hypothetical protein